MLPESSWVISTRAGNCDEEDPCPETAIYDSRTGSCACAIGMEAASGNIQEDGCRCTGPNQYAAYNIFQGKFALCDQCAPVSSRHSLLYPDVLKAAFLRAGNLRSD